MQTRTLASFLRWSPALCLAAAQAADNSWALSPAASVAGPACTPCAAGSFSLAGATSAAQCRPTPFAGPTDTAFSFYGTAAEVAADYTVTGTAASITYVADAFGGASSALSLTGAAYATTTTTRLRRRRLLRHLRPSSSSRKLMVAMVVPTVALGRLRWPT
jgi:hypothetical protein